MPNLLPTWLLTNITFYHYWRTLVTSNWKTLLDKFFPYTTLRNLNLIQFVYPHNRTPLCFINRNGKKGPFQATAPRLPVTDLPSIGRCEDSERPSDTTTDRSKKKKMTNGCGRSIAYFFLILLLFLFFQFYKKRRAPVIVNKYPVYSTQNRSLNK